jgi:hypothetical protein
MIAEAVRTCSVKGCGRESKKRGICIAHYLRLQRLGDVLVDKPVRVHHSHGMCGQGIYIIWGNIVQRCFNPKNTHYDRYGGRGITMCDEWRNSFPAFLKSIGTRPGPDYEIDRIDNDGNYEPGNCRWVTHARNVRNSSVTKLDENRVREIRASNLSRKELALIYGVARDTIGEIRSGRRNWRDVAVVSA